MNACKRVKRRRVCALCTRICTISERHGFHFNKRSFSLTRLRPQNVFFLLVCFCFPTPWSSSSPCRQHLRYRPGFCTRPDAMSLLHHCPALDLQTLRLLLNDTLVRLTDTFRIVIPFAAFGSPQPLLLLVLFTTIISCNYASILAFFPFSPFHFYSHLVGYHLPCESHLGKPGFDAFENSTADSLLIGCPL